MFLFGFLARRKTSLDGLLSASVQRVTMSDERSVAHFAECTPPLYQNVKPLWGYRRSITADLALRQRSYREERRVRWTSR